MNDQHGRTHLDRQQILDATAACLKEHGYDGTTIRQIAGRLGCAVGSLYRYFTDKRQLLSALTEQPFEDLALHAEAGLPITQTCQCYYAAAQADATSYRLMFWLAAVSQASGPPPSANVRLPGAVLRLLDQWARQLGDLAASQHLWAALHGGILLGQALPTVLANVEAAIGLPAAGDAATLLPPLPQPDGHQALPTLPASPAPAPMEEPVAIAADAEAEDVCLL